MVLFPHGQPAMEHHRLRCSEMLLRCGGDVSRVIDSPTTSVDDFGIYCSRIRGLREGNLVPLVVLARTNPVGLMVLEARRRLEAKVPLLSRAGWIIWHDTDEDPFFLSSAERMGSFTGSLADAPVWRGPAQQKFLVLCPEVKDLSGLGKQLAEAQGDPFEDTGERWIGPSRG